MQVQRLIGMQQQLEDYRLEPALVLQLLLFQVLPIFMRVLLPEEQQYRMLERLHLQLVYRRWVLTTWYLP